ncbi:hypothetical protein [Streptomyces sp. NPDC060184]|uniref:hypothetical protein n=1 Tax=Streptomyces sp. NPDC060184 TaxID=3347064 RepID=UPI003665395B
MAETGGEPRGPGDHGFVHGDGALVGEEFDLAAVGRRHHDEQVACPLQQAGIDGVGADQVGEEHRLGDPAGLGGPHVPGRDRDLQEPSAGGGFVLAGQRVDEGPQLPLPDAAVEPEPGRRGAVESVQRPHDRCQEVPQQAEDAEIRDVLGFSDAGEEADAGAHRCHARTAAHQLPGDGESGGPVLQRQVRDGGPDGPLPGALLAQGPVDALRRTLGVAVGQQGCEESAYGLLARGEACGGALGGTVRGACREGAARHAGCAVLRGVALREGCPVLRGVALPEALGTCRVRQREAAAGWAAVGRRPEQPQRVVVQRGPGWERPALFRGAHRARWCSIP